jgi:glycine dehydrogenase
LKRAPHTAQGLAGRLLGPELIRGRLQHILPPWTGEHKFWPVIGRIDNVERNLFCTCIPIEAIEPS